MKNLVILTGLSCTLKDSISDYLVEKYNLIKFPDVNRNYVGTLTSIATNPEILNLTCKVPNIMLCANRLGIYNTYLDGIESVQTKNKNNLFVCQRTVLEHLFFDNIDLITLVDKEKLIKAENEFLSRFDNVLVVLINNFNKTMLTKFYLTDEIRSSITKSDNKLEAYKRMQEPYARFIEQLRPIDLKYQISDTDSEITSAELTSITKEIGDSIFEKLTNYGK